MSSGTFTLLLILGILYCLSSLCGMGVTALALWLGFAEGNFTSQLAATIALPAAALFLFLAATGIIYLRTASTIRRRPPNTVRAASTAALANTAVFSLLVIVQIRSALIHHPNLTDFAVGSLFCMAVIGGNVFLAFMLRRHQRS